MSQLIVLSDAELDAVSGGFLNAGSGGSGGSGGTAMNGAQSQEVLMLGWNNLSVNGSTATANGGSGGSGGSVFLVPLFHH